VAGALPGAGNKRHGENRNGQNRRRDDHDPSIGFHRIRLLDLAFSPFLSRDRNEGDGGNATK
jgi:hypothetical protein